MFARSCDSTANVPTDSFVGGKNKFEFETKATIYKKKTTLRIHIVRPKLTNCTFEWDSLQMAKYCIKWHSIGI